MSGNQPVVLATEIGSSTDLISIISLQYTWTVSATHKSTMMNGTLTFSGIVTSRGS